ncbi:MAG: DUF2306 domain-containing protein [Pseudomonadota bacterium]
MSKTSLIITAAITVFITATLTFLSAFGGGFASSAGGDPAGAAARTLTLPIGLHLATAACAALLGPFILLRRKGDAPHKALGRTWAALMLITAISSAFIRAPGAGIAGTGFSFIHIFTVWTLVTLPMGVWAARNGQVRMHRGIMVGLYIGLLIAGGFTFIPGRLLGNLVFGG